MTDINQLIARWNTDEGKPYKGSLIDMYSYRPGNLGCMCAQGQVLHEIGGWTAEKLNDTEQSEADTATAKMLNISRACCSHPPGRARQHGPALLDRNPTLPEEIRCLTADSSGSRTFGVTMEPLPRCSGCAGCRSGGPTSTTQLGSMTERNPNG